MTDSRQTPERFLPLHPLEFRILLVLSEGPSHGYAIVQEIEARETILKAIHPANLYRRIRDLLSKGLLEDVAPPEGEAPDPRRRYFGITSLGAQVVQAETERLRLLLGDAESVRALNGA